MDGSTGENNGDSILSRFPLPVCAVDESGRIRRWNDLFLRMFPSAAGRLRDGVLELDGLFGARVELDCNEALALDSESGCAVAMFLLDGVLAERDEPSGARLYCFVPVSMYLSDERSSFCRLVWDSVKSALERMEQRRQGLELLLKDVEVGVEQLSQLRVLMRHLEGVLSLARYYDSIPATSQSCRDVRMEANFMLQCLFSCYRSRCKSQGVELTHRPAGEMWLDGSSAAVMLKVTVGLLQSMLGGMGGSNRLPGGGEGACMVFDLVKRGGVMSLRVSVPAEVALDKRRSVLYPMWASRVGGTFSSLRATAGRSVFELELPLAGGGGHGRYVLLLEDEGDMVESLAYLLEPMGYDVEHFVDPESFLAHLERHVSQHGDRRPPSLLMLDWGLLGGGEVLARLRSGFPHLLPRCVIMSGDTRGVSCIEEFLDEGVRLLDKPFGKARIREILLELDGGSCGRD